VIGFFVIKPVFAISGFWKASGTDLLYYLADKPSGQENDLPPETTKECR
jgi:hypothetical protein